VRIDDSRERKLAQPADKQQSQPILPVPGEGSHTIEQSTCVAKQWEVLCGSAHARPVPVCEGTWGSPPCYDCFLSRGRRGQLDSSRRHYRRVNSVCVLQISVQDQFRTKSASSNLWPGQLNGWLLAPETGVSVSAHAQPTCFGKLHKRNSQPALPRSNKIVYSATVCQDTEG
jgi:hypothetical protein